MAGRHIVRENWPVRHTYAPVAVAGERVCKAEIRLDGTLYLCKRHDMHGGVHNAGVKHPGDDRPVRW